MFLMTDAAVRYVEETKVGKLASVRLLLWWTRGSQESFDISLQDDAYAFIFSQQGLMAGSALRNENFPNPSVNELGRTRFASVLNCLSPAARRRDNAAMINAESIHTATIPSLPLETNDQTGESACL